MHPVKTQSRRIKKKWQHVSGIKRRKTDTHNRNTDGSFVCTFLHQTEELLCGAVVTVLLVQLLYCGQQLVDDGL